jgi:dihydroorotase-like cyclic amidohydrolase
VDYDLLIRAGSVLTPEGERELDIAVGDGAIAALGPQLNGSAREELDARGLHVLPGGIDAHVHCDEPGRTDWEGFATATAALAAGGMTAFVDARRAPRRRRRGSTSRSGAASSPATSTTSRECTSGARLASRRS